MLQRQFYNEQDLRKRQIDTLKIFNENVTELIENTEYKLDFTVNSMHMTLNVVLGPEFPNEKPKIFVNPPISHPWLLDMTNQVVGAPGLLNYTLHSDLGRVVQAIIREFQKSLPGLSAEGKSSEVSPQSHYSSQSLMYPELNELSIDELREVLENTDWQDQLIENSPQLVEMDQEAEVLMSSIEQIAEDNILKQQMVEDMKTEVIDRMSTIYQMKMDYEEFGRKYHKLSEMYDPHRIRDCLKEAALKADEESEAIAEQFLMGNMSVETFIAKFAEKRALGQARRAREERLAHQLAQLDRAI